MARLNRKDYATALPQLEGTIEELQAELDELKNKPEEPTREIFVSTSAPTQADGKDGDIWITYEV